MISKRGLHVTQAIGTHGGFAAAQRVLGAAIAAGFAVAAVALAAEARADLATYYISGTIAADDVGILFPGKSVGQSFGGSFTIDTDAELQSTSSGNTQATYTGAFSVVIQGTSYPVHALSVWSGGPAGVDDGFELSFAGGGSSSGFVSLRSSQDLYLLPGVPTAVDLAEMDSLATISVNSPPPFFTSDRGTIAQLPEPAGAASGLAAIAVLAAVARRAYRRG